MFDTLFAFFVVPVTPPIWLIDHATSTTGWVYQYCFHIDKLRIVWFRLQKVNVKKSNVLAKTVSYNDTGNGTV